jgi:hypothetical protein
MMAGLEFPAGFLFARHHLIIKRALGTKMVSEIAFILTVVLRVPPVLCTICEWKSLNIFFIVIDTAVHS